MKNKKAELYNSEIIDDLFDSSELAEANRIKNKMILAAKIDDAMKAQGLSKSQFAAKMGKKNSVITKWLSGTHNFTADTLFDIGRVLEIELINLNPCVNHKTKVYKASASTAVRIQEIKYALNSLFDDNLTNLYTTQIVSHLNNPVSNYKC